MSDDTLIVEVSDTGMGIPEDKISTLTYTFIKLSRIRRSRGRAMIRQI